jgi:hypothetical protein
VSFEHRALLEALADLLNRRDWDALTRICTSDSVLEYPQSGEVFRGLANQRAQYENYPGGLHEGALETMEVRGEPRQFAQTPRFTVVAVEGTGNRGTATFRGTYPDASVWWVIVFYETDGERITHTTTYFAPEFEAPEWRAPYREAPVGDKPTTRN